MFRDSARDAVFAFVAFMVPPLLVEIFLIRAVILTNSRGDVQSPAFHEDRAALVLRGQRYFKQEAAAPTPLVIGLEKGLAFSASP